MLGAALAATWRAPAEAQTRSQMLYPREELTDAAGYPAVAGDTANFAQALTTTLLMNLDVAGVTLATVQARGGKPFDVSGVDSSYGYRAIATPLADGSGIVVVAVSTASINGTMNNVALASLAVGLLTLGLVALLSGWVIGVGLRPLELPRGLSSGRRDGRGSLPIELRGLPRLRRTAEEVRRQSQFPRPRSDESAGTRTTPASCAPA